MNVRDIELEIEVNTTDEWLDELDSDWDEWEDAEDWEIDLGDDDVLLALEDEFDDDFADWEIDLLDNEV